MGPWTCRGLPSYWIIVLVLIFLTVDPYPRDHKINRCEYRELLDGPYLSKKTLDGIGSTSFPW